jgi:hypothetical protein
LTLLKNNERFIVICQTLKLLRWCLIVLVVTPIAAHAESGSGSYPFGQGSERLSIHFGGATAFNRNYSIFGIGGGYSVADGIEVGLDAEVWFGNSPGIEQISPQIRLVLSTNGSVNPYAGLFYRRTHIQGYRDNDTVGARAGVYFQTGRSAYFGAGVVQDIHLNCDRTVYSSCTEINPEILFAILFR